MGAARHTQRAQEHAQRRIARDDGDWSTNAARALVASHRGSRSAPTQEETLASMDREYAELVDDYIELKKQRDRLRAAVDGVAAAMKQRAIRGHVIGDGTEERIALDVLALLESHGFGGER